MLNQELTGSYTFRGLESKLSLALGPSFLWLVISFPSPSLASFDSFFYGLINPHDGLVVLVTLWNRSDGSRSRSYGVANLE